MPHFDVMEGNGDSPRLIELIVGLYRCNDLDLISTVLPSCGIIDSVKQAQIELVCQQLNSIFDEFDYFESQRFKSETFAKNSEFIAMRKRLLEQNHVKKRELKKTMLEEISKYPWDRSGLSYFPVPKAGDLAAQLDKIKGITITSRDM